MKDLRRNIDSIHNLQLCQYLRNNKWHEDGAFFNGNVIQFLTPNREDAVLIPIIKEFSDYYRVMADSLKTIASVENDTIKGLLIKLLNPVSDILKWRIANDDTSIDTIPFSSVRDNINSIKDLLSSSCLDILSPSIIHKKQSTKKVQEQISTYKFGQTEIGSFILNIICPINLDGYSPSVFDTNIEDLPLSRRINIRLINNINIIQTSIKNKSALLKERVDAREISVNFLKALLNLYDINKDTSYEISAKWNTAVINPEDVINHVELVPKCMDKVAETIECFEDKKDQTVENAYYGKIVNINGEPELDKREDVLITVATINDKGKIQKVKCSLNYTEYYSVIDEAFQDSLTVKVTGNPDVSKKNHLQNGTIE
ncbi:MAG: hypothetical protein K2H85_06610, partial [Allobaculum sp.]|nr:hypothetical protein [Allobaculum sp.]